MKWLYHDVNCVRTWRWLPEKFQTSSGVTSDVACTKSASELPLRPNLSGNAGIRVRSGISRSKTILGLPPSYIAPGVVGTASLGGLGLGYYAGSSGNEDIGGQGITVADAPVTNNTHMYVVVPEPSAAWILLYSFILLLLLGKITKR